MLGDPDSAACADSLFMILVGTLICGTLAPTRTRSGIAPASLLGNSGMRQVARRPSFGACKRGGALKVGNGYGRALRLTIKFRSFEYGTNTGTPRGRSCSISGACLIFRSSIVTPTPQNQPLRREDEAQHAPSNLN
jgi:hypothetical protein